MAVIPEYVRTIFCTFSVGLDPDEIDRKDETASNNTFAGLQHFLEQELSETEREHFLTKTITNMARLAKRLKELKPPDGLSFLLQQQGSTVELSTMFVASLVANAFFSTFPNRNAKTHPTLQNFNFSHFFEDLKNRFVYVNNMKMSFLG